MRTLKFVVVMTIATVASAAFAGDGLNELQKQCPNMRAITYFFFERRQIEVIVSPDDLDASPRWNAGSFEEPPLNPGRAVQLASAEFRRAVSDPSGWHVTNVALTLLPCGQRAYYQISWQRNAPGPQSEVTVPVLMSGVVVPTAGAITGSK
jgi:hypothetical protein